MTLWNATSHLRYFLVTCMSFRVVILQIVFDQGGPITHGFPPLLLVALSCILDLFDFVNKKILFLVGI